MIIRKVKQREDEKVKTERILVDREHIDGKVMERAGQILRQGGLVAFPTETVYGLGGNALDPEASRKIYEAKGRPSDNPLIAHIGNLSQLPLLAREIPETARKLIDRFWPGPLTLIFEKTEAVPYATTGGLDTVAVRFPSDPVAKAFIEAAGVPVAAPSANTSGRPSPTTAEHVKEDLDGRIDMILDGGPVSIGLESTIVDVTGPTPMILRPGYITLEMLRETVGEAGVDPAVLKKPSGDLRPKAPGMKYRHYAPKGQLIIFKGSRENVKKAILERGKALLAQGKRVGVICCEEDETEFSALGAVSIGKREDEEAIAHNLYYILRRFDEEGTEVIFSESFDGSGLFAAIMNRLVKAAGYHIEEV